MVFSLVRVPPCAASGWEQRLLRQVSGAHDSRPARVVPDVRAVRCERIRPTSGLGRLRCKQWSVVRRAKRFLGEALNRRCAFRSSVLADAALDQDGGGPEASVVVLRIHCARLRLRFVRCFDALVHCLASGRALLLSEGCYRTWR